MARKVIWTQAAWNDLEEIADHIAKDSIHYAAAFVREVRDAARILRRFARRGRIVPEFHNTNLRELFVRNYRLIYRVAPGKFSSWDSCTAHAICGLSGTGTGDPFQRWSSCKNPLL